jgi:hypothetical protein
LSINSLYHQRIIGLTEQHGSVAERQLLGRWKAELDAFLKPAEKALIAGQVGLEFGIEDTLTLKVNLKSRVLSPAPTLASMIMKSSPALTPWGNYIIQQRLRFHCGIKLMPDRLSREIYVYPKDHRTMGDLLGDNPFRHAVEDIQPNFLGIDDQRGYSMYFDATDTAWVAVLLKELGLQDWQGATALPWQQVRFDGAALLSGKTALELQPLPAAVLARFASHYPFPYFRYLIPLREHTNGNFGRDPVTGRFALYATVN